MPPIIRVLDGTEFDSNRSAGKAVARSTGCSTRVIEEENALLILGYRGDILFPSSIVLSALLIVPDRIKSLSDQFLHNFLIPKVIGPFIPQKIFVQRIGVVEPMMFVVVCIFNGDDTMRIENRLSETNEEEIHDECSVVSAMKQYGAPLRPRLPEAIDFQMDRLSFAIASLSDDVYSLLNNVDELET
ncbi:hypothetical protein DICVIV_12793 [Dictyocaulus viviparus]|uniref:Uncharacterized protein n=1 Tax=Dictyocaulus viviparus TaxID=29172 RepID=A0A0D8XC61_DICVI|nr:hypothetical protein DICVIV_12793 [Dictyocaulus viviparus]